MSLPMGPPAKRSRTESDSSNGHSAASRGTFTSIATAGNESSDVHARRRAKLAAWKSSQTGFVPVEAVSAKEASSSASGDSGRIVLRLDTAVKSRKNSSGVAAVGRGGKAVSQGAGGKTSVFDRNWDSQSARSRLRPVRRTLPKVSLSSNMGSAVNKVPPLSSAPQAESGNGTGGGSDAVDAVDAFMQEVEAEVARIESTSLSDEYSDVSAVGQKDGASAAHTESGNNQDVDADADNDKEARQPTVLEPFRKSFYTPVPEIQRMTKADARLYRRDELEGTKVRGIEVENPIKRFTQCGFPERILRCLSDECGYTAPSPVQAQGLPCLLSGRDVIACAKTGSGKTLAFALPALIHCLGQRRVEPGEGPIVLILVPTRELCAQVFREIARLCRALSVTHDPGPGALPKGQEVRCLAVHGGADVAGQFAQLKRGSEIVVATPGRMIDVLLANQGRITNMKRCTFVILDEADRMFDMGFEPQITRVLFNTRRDRQTALFSATFPWAVEALARQILRKEHRPVEIVVGARSVVSDTVTQHVEVMQEGGMKFPRLLQILKDYNKKGKILVFVDRQETCDAVFTQLTTREGHMCLTLHGGLDQEDRDNAIQEFKNGDIHTLIATSVAARGLDVPELILVVNYDVPNHLEDYVHRVGRTGRAGNHGTAITFIVDNQTEQWFAPDIARALRDSKSTISPELAAMNERVLAQRREQRSSKPRQQKAGSRGFGGTGLGSEAAREKAKRDARTTEALAFGAFAAASQADAVHAQELAAAAVGAQEADEEFPEAADAPEEVMEMREREKAAAAAASGNAPGKGESRSATEDVDPTEAKIQAMLGKLDSKLRSDSEERRRVLPSGASVLIAGNGSKHFQMELTINDVHEYARSKITHKDCLNQISDMCNVSVTPRGVFVPAGRNPPPGQSKLALLIEGKEEGLVLEAKKELESIISESGALGFGGPTGGFQGGGGYTGANATKVDYGAQQRRQFLTYR